MGQFENIVVGGAEQMLAEDLAGVDLVEPVGIVRRQKFLPFAAVERGAVGRDRDEESSSPSSRRFAVLIAATTLAMPERPKYFSPARVFGSMCRRSAR